MIVDPNNGLPEITVLTMVEVWFTIFFVEQQLSLLIYCSGLLSAAGDTGEQSYHPGQAF